MDADHRVVRAEMETREIPGMSRSSVRSSVMALRMGVGMNPWRDSVRVVRSVDCTMPMTEMRRDKNGTAEIITKKDACAA